MARKSAARGRPRTHANRVFLMRGAIAVVALAVVGFVVVRNSGSDGAALNSQKDDGGHGSHVYAWVDLPKAEQATLDAQWARARAAALKYPTVADAVKAGWVVAQGNDETGAHVVNFDRLDGKFSIDEPDMLLYRSTAPDAPVIAVSYHVVTTSATPPHGFISDNDHWHRHQGICWSADHKVEAVGISDQECTARGGSRLGRSDGWMLHVWIVPGWKNPDGVYASLNKKLAPQS